MGSLKVSIIGSGYVGLVSGACFAEIGHNVLCIDNNEEKIKVLKSGRCPIYEPGLTELLEKNIAAGKISFSTSIEEAVKKTEIIFIAVNTPPREDGSADLSFVENAAREIAEKLANLPDGSYRLIVDKSTVPVETGDKVARTVKLYAPHNREFDVASNPEFLREGSAIEDFLKPNRIVVGVTSPRSEALMRELYAPIDAPLLVTDIYSAEIIKHASNSFLAMKISFINAVAQLAEITGADVELIARGMGLDKRIGASFLCAGLGYGGSCFPKDVKAFYRIAKDKGIDFSILKEVERINEEQRNNFVRKVHDALWVVKGKKLGVWGLSFKPNTDDMRSAPSIDIINALITEGAEISAYDPVAIEKAKPHLPSSVHFVKTKEEAIEGADALLVITEWQEFKNARPEEIKKILKRPVVIDGRNIFLPEKMKHLGFVYYSVGRPAVIGLKL